MLEEGESAVGYLFWLLLLPLVDNCRRGLGCLVLF